MSIQELRERVERAIHPREGVCGACHAVAEEICQAGWSIQAQELPDGILARILDERGQPVGEGLGIVWSPAVLAAELDAGLIPPRLEEQLRRDGTSDQETITRVAELSGFGRVVTSAVIALNSVKEAGGRTLIRRVGMGVIAEFQDSGGRVVASSPPSYCPTCAVTVAAAFYPPLAEKMRAALRDRPNTGRKKRDLGIVNHYHVKDGHVRVTLTKGDETLAHDVLGCCMAYATVKAEIAANLVPQASAEQFKLYCNLCPFKHCWMEKSMGATGNVILQRLSDIGAEIEVSADGGIVARVAGVEVEGRGTLCSLSALTNMLLRGDAQEILKPSPSRR